jgi:hypothetical protein
VTTSSTTTKSWAKSRTANKRPRASSTCSSGWN